MKGIPAILLSVFLTSTIVSGQKIEFGIQYAPLQFSSLSFDQNYVIFDDHTSYNLNVTGLNLTIPSLSNSGLFVRYPFGNLALQTGFGFQNNVNYYSVKTTYQDTKVAFFYSSIDIPASLAYTFRSNEKLKFRILAGANAKMFKIRRSYYSIFAKSFDIFFNTEDFESDRQKREFMVNKVNPFMLYSRIGAGIGYYNFTMDICADKNISTMNLKHDQYNANFKDSYLVTVVLGFRLAGKELKGRKDQGKINKE